MKVPTAESERRLDELRARARELQPKQSYHDLPLLKPPVWTWEIPVYFFVGGAGGAASMIAVAAQIGGANPTLVRDARRIAAISAALSGPLLVSDLGRPERFLNMLRVFKPRSPMSVGAWTLAAWSAATAVAAFNRRGAATAGVVAAATGLVMSTYTGVLLGATAIPVWSRNARLLPVHFGASSLGSSVAILELRGHDDAALNALGLGAAIFETAAGAAMSRIADVLAGPVPLALRILGARSKKARQAAAVSTLLGSLLTRFAWVEAGKVSARDAGVVLDGKRA